MPDILETLRFKERSTTYEMPHHIFKRAADEIERLRAALQAIADDADTNVDAAVYAKNTLAALTPDK